MLLEAFVFPRLAFSRASQNWFGDYVESSMERCCVHRAALLELLLDSMMEHNLAGNVNLWTTNVLMNDAKSWNRQTLSTAKQIQSILSTR